MYTTKCQNKNNINTSYISIGDKYNDPAKRNVPSSRFKGTQFRTNPAKNTSGGIGYFTKFDYSAGNTYKDTLGFMKEQPIDQRKLGFGSHDASKRGEFTTTIRTEQYREQLVSEATKVVKLPSDLTDQDGDGDVDELDLMIRNQKEARKLPGTLKTAKHLYDIGRSQETEFDPKCKVDTYYNALACKSRVREDRVLGSHRTSNNDFGGGVAGKDMSEYKPKHGRISTTSQFYDRGSLN
jgi:hypothetical protein